MPKELIECILFLAIVMVIGWAYLEGYRRGLKDSEKIAKKAMDEAEITWDGYNWVIK